MSPFVNQALLHGLMCHTERTISLLNEAAPTDIDMEDGGSRRLFNLDLVTVHIVLNYAPARDRLNFASALLNHQPDVGRDVCRMMPGSVSMRVRKV